MNIKKLVLGASASAIMLGNTVLPAFAASLVTNGGFESGTAPGVFLTVGTGGTDIDDWDVVSGNVDYIGSYWVAQEGDRSIDMTGNAAGAISQTFATTIGEDYTVTFYLAGNPAGGPAVKSLNVDAGGAPVNYSFDTTGKSLTDMGWTQETFNFTATTALTTLTFTSLTPGFFGPALDNVAVELVLTTPTNKDECKKGGWQTFNNPVFKNQGQCVSYVNHNS